jgi:hypothetical protein
VEAEAAEALKVEVVEAVEMKVAAAAGLRSQRRWWRREVASGAHNRFRLLF